MIDTERFERLEREVQRVRDWQDISNLHGRYNHLVLGHHWQPILDMFSHSPEVTAEVAESGVFHGTEGVHKVFVDMLGKLYNYTGMLALHELTTPVIEVAQDGKTAKGMWFTWGANTNNHPQRGLIPIWQSLKYNHVFIKEEGRWKFLHFRAHLIIRSSFDQGWIKEPYIGGSTIKGTDAAAVIQSDAPTTFHDPYDPTQHYQGLPLPPEPY
ncbi:MAG: nuclear transport factor 2 family protein [Steroidobacteraceae bacterium]